MAEDKPHMNLVTIGHVDHGKSTLIGRLLWDTGNIPETEMRKLKDLAQEHGKETFEFAFVMDNLKDERERGVTIDLAHQRFDTDKYFFTIIDAPGHRDFVKNMITGASQADCAILVVDVNDGVQPQTREHAYLAKTLGIQQLVVAINKMDSADFDQSKFDQTKDQVKKLLQGVGFSDVEIIPVSAYTGDNVVEASDQMDWYEGPTIKAVLDSFEPPEQPVNQPLRIPIQDSYKIKGVGAVQVGRVESGKVKLGDNITVEPAATRMNKQVGGEVRSVEMHHESVNEAQPGDNIGFNVRGVSAADVKRGDVASLTDNPPTVADEFTAQIIVLNHPNVVTVGYTPVFHVNTAQVACTFTELQKKMDPKTGETKEENPDYLKAGDAAVVKLKPTQPLVIESNKEIPEMSRFAIRDMGMTVGAGMCLEVTSKK